MEGVQQNADCRDATVYYIVFTINGVFATVTIVISVFATFKLIQKQYEIYRQGPIYGSSYSFSLLTAHVLFFLICIVTSVCRLPLLSASCFDARSNGSMYFMMIYVSAFLLHWGGLVIIHSQRLRQVFDGTALEASVCYPVTTSIVVIIALAVFALNFIGLAYHIEALQRVSHYFMIITVVGLVISSKTVAVAFIVKFYHFSNAMAGVDGDCINFVRLMTKSTILAVISLLSSSTVAIALQLALSTAFPAESAWYFVLSSHSLDMLTNCVCIYLSLSVGSTHYDSLCGPLHNRCQKFCLRMSRNRLLKTQRRKKKSTQETKNTIADGSVELSVQVPAPVEEEGTAGKEVKLEEIKETENETTRYARESLEEMHRMSRRISFVGRDAEQEMAHHLQCRTTGSLINTIKNEMLEVHVQRTERNSVPSGSTLQIGVGVLTNTKSSVSADVVEIGGRAIEMDDEEELDGQP